MAFSWPQELTSEILGLCEIYKASRKFFKACCLAGSSCAMARSCMTRFMRAIDFLTCKPSQKPRMPYQPTAQLDGVMIEYACALQSAPSALNRLKGGCVILPDLAHVRAQASARTRHDADSKQGSRQGLKQGLTQGSTRPFQ